MSKLRDAIRGIQDAAKSLDDAAEDLRAHESGAGAGGAGGAGGTGGTGGTGGQRQPRQRRGRGRFRQGAKEVFRDSRYGEKLHIDSYARDIDRMLAIDARYATMTGKHMNDVEGSWGNALSVMGREMRKFSLDAPGLLDSVLELPIKMRTAGLDMAKDKTLPNQLAKTVSFFDELGISAHDTMDLLDMTTVGFEASSQEALGLAISVREMSKELGKTPEELIQSYGHLQKTLSYSLGKINSEFRKLEIQSRATGIPVQELVGAFGDQLDTFEGSAEAAGRLNAVLGGSYLNSLELLNATESERVDMVKKAMKAAGTNLQDLQKGKGFGLKAIASSLNLPIDQTRRLLSGRSDQVMKDLQSKGIKGPSMDTAELEGSIDSLGAEVQRLHGPQAELILQTRGLKDAIILQRKDGEDLMPKEKQFGLFGFYLKMMEESVKAEGARKETDPLRDPSTGLFTGLQRMKPLIDDPNVTDVEKLARVNLFIKQLETSTKAFEKVGMPTTVAEPLAIKSATKVSPMTQVRGQTTPQPTSGTGGLPGAAGTTPAAGRMQLNIILPNGKTVKNLTAEFLKAMRNP